jgi:hypothetical protein
VRRAVIAALCVGVATAALAAAALAQDNAEGIDVSATAGKQFTSPVASFTHPTPEPPGIFSATIEWGDGTPQSAGTIAQVACPFPDLTCYEASGTHTYASPGTYEVQTTIMGPDPDVLPTVSSTATVAPAGTASASLLGPGEVRGSGSPLGSSRM